MTLTPARRRALALLAYAATDRRPVFVAAGATTPERAQTAGRLTVNLTVADWLVAEQLVVVRQDPTGTSLTLTGRGRDVAAEHVGADA